jgi:hypothetical protein
VKSGSGTIAPQPAATCGVVTGRPLKIIRRGVSRSPLKFALTCRQNKSRLLFGPLYLLFCFLCSLTC